MRVTRDTLLSASPSKVWDLLWDVPRMVACVPGCVEAREVEPGRRWEARMSQRVGPFTLSVPLVVEAVDVEAPRRLALHASGRDAFAAATVSMRVGLDLSPAEAGTRLTVDADARVLGKLGALGHGVIQRKAEESLEEFLTRLRQALEA
jgi:carbon monoxide dehydrogenase subunit G